MNPGDTLKPPWWALHTRSRSEKKVVEFLEEQLIPADLPVYRSVRRYRGKTITFQKPLFPGYVFARFETHRVSKISSCRHLAGVLEIFDQQIFESQLRDIHEALLSSLPIRLVPSIVEGIRVRIRSGPLRGIEGIVEQRSGLVEVHLRLDFIGQAAAVRVSVDELEET